MFSAMKIYKIENYFYKKRLFFLSKFFYKLNYYLHNSHIPASIEMGGCTFAYGGIGMVIHHNVKIGNNCVIGQGVTIGGKVGAKNVPIIGSNVYIGAGVRILGNVTIEDNCVIAPNSVIVKNVESYSVMTGIPTKK